MQAGSKRRIMSEEGIEMAAAHGPDLRAADVFT
jgi:hypothetical protein